jgi:glutamyl-tRNA synthetase
MSMSNLDIKKEAIKYAALNASQHEGKAQSGSVIGKVLAEHEELKPRVKEIIPIINEGVSEVNSWTQEEQASFIKENHPELLETSKVEEEKEMPPLEDVEDWPMIKTRFAPNPDGALHLGSAEPIIFCDEYARMYDGHFILRYEDTSSDVKPPIPEMYDKIIEDLNWLGVKVDEKYIQSERLEIYYEYAEKILQMGNAYVCTCPVEEFRHLYMNMMSCPCRELDPDMQLQRWRKMLDGTYDKGEAVVRIKTDLEDPNPAIRDWPALRISDTPHPLQGTKYRVWPLYNFSCGIDDHLMGVSHVIRGKEHDVNSTRQQWLHSHMGWKTPTVINVGRVGLEETILSKSKMRNGIEEGIYWGWDDPRLGSLAALRRRGLQPEAIRSIMIHIGPKPVNVMLTWDNIAAENRNIIEPLANRYFFIENPTRLKVSGIENNLIAKLPRHPDQKEKGTRDYTIKPVEGAYDFNISSSDLERMVKGGIVRLMGLMNMKIKSVSEEKIEAEFHSKDYMKAREKDAPFIHWLPAGRGFSGKVAMPDASFAEGIVSDYCKELEIDQMIQFERFGFCRVDSVDPFVAFYTHN